MCEPRTLYKRDGKGVIRYWKCYKVEGGIEMEHGVLDGKSQVQFEKVASGKAGRDLDQQIALRMNSRANKKMDAGYIASLDEVKGTDRVINRLGFLKPMLAKKQEDVDLDLLCSKPYYIQYKLDGNRCLVHNDGNRLIAYTRNGKEFGTLEHILEKLQGVIPPGQTLDGELYIHGVSLQNIVSLVKRKQPDTDKIIYHIYDTISESPFSERHKLLESILADFKDTTSSPIRLLKTTRCEGGPSQIYNAMKQAREQGYEGLMIRSDNKIVRRKLQKAGYEDGKRSGSLIKFKEWISEDFVVKDIVPSKDGWARCICLISDNPQGKTFAVSCPGDMEFRHHVMEHKEEFIGKELTCDFAYWTKDGVPFHPTAVIFRDYE